MSNEGVKSVMFKQEDYPEVVEVANKLATLENRKPHDSIKNLILEEGRKKIERLKEGFTIIELLTVMSIIVILISLLIPSLQMVRRYSRKVVQKGQFHNIQMGLEMFSIDFDDYPDSDPCDMESIPYCGAMKLCEAMLGQDGLGFHPDSKFYRSGWSGPGETGRDLYREPPPPITPAERRARKNPYIDLVNKYRICVMQDLYGTADEDTAPFDPNSTVISDVFYRIQNQTGGEKLGMPVLYYKADIGKLYHDPDIIANGGGFGDNIYDYRDNNMLVELRVPDRLGDAQLLYYSGVGIPDVFYENTFSKEIVGFRKPYNEESYILISAGWDGLYGTRDDVHNFAN